MVTSGRFICWVSFVCGLIFCLPPNDGGGYQTDQKDYASRFIEPTGHSAMELVVGSDLRSRVLIGYPSELDIVNTPLNDNHDTEKRSADCLDQSHFLSMPTLAPHKFDSGCRATERR